MMMMMMMVMCCGCVSGRMDVAVLRARVQITPSRDWQDSQFYHRDFLNLFFSEENHLENVRNSRKEKKRNIYIYIIQMFSILQKDREGTLGNNGTMRTIVSIVRSPSGA